MALKFLNKKGWHTGSLRNIENVWKAEQKHEAEQKKLEELRKQILEERERSEFRLLQEQAGLVPKQERLEFLYDSGLAVGKGSSSGGFKALESSSSKTDLGAASSSSSKLQQASLPGALFEEKQQSSNDAWRKLHSDPLLLIRQREQEALTRVKNNPIQMAMIRKSVEATKNKNRIPYEDDKEAPRRKHHHKKKHERHSSSRHHSDSENPAFKEHRKSSSRKGSHTTLWSSEDELSNGDTGRKSSSHKYSQHRERQSSAFPDSRNRKIVTQQGVKESWNNFQDAETYSEGRRLESVSYDREKKERKTPQSSKFDSSDIEQRHERKNRHRNPVKLSEEERAARLLEMQMDAELHEEQRWKRLKKAEENDVQEAARAGISKGRNFLDDVQKSVYGTDKGGSSTIEENVRRRTHYLQGGSEATEGNAFRR